MIHMEIEHRCEVVKSSKYNFNDTKSPSLIHLHHPSYPQHQRQIKYSLDDDVRRLSPPPRPRELLRVDFPSLNAMNINDEDSNRIFIDRTNFVGESHDGCSDVVMCVHRMCRICFGKQQNLRIIH